MYRKDDVCECGHPKELHPYYEGDTGCVEMKDFVFEGEMETALCDCKKYRSKIHNKIEVKEIKEALSEGKGE